MKVLGLNLLGLKGGGRREKGVRHVPRVEHWIVGCG